MTRIPALLIAAGITVMVMIGAFAAIESRQAASSLAAATATAGTIPSAASVQPALQEPIGAQDAGDAQYAITVTGEHDDDEDHDDHDRVKKSEHKAKDHDGESDKRALSTRGTFDTVAGRDHDERDRD